LESASSDSKSHSVIRFSLYKVFFRRGFEYYSDGAVIEYYAVIVVVRTRACSSSCCRTNWAIDFYAAM